MKKMLALALAGAMFVAAPVLAVEERPRVRIGTTEGEMVIELDPEKAPQTVKNFLRYVGENFYDGTIFHRVIRGFMIQGGGLTADLQKKPTHAPIANEADNGLKNIRGAIAMARTMDPHSATAQFFINTANNGFLDHREKSVPGWGYCVFGRVVEGMQVLDAIEAVVTTVRAGRRDVPETPVVVGKAVLMENTRDQPSEKSK